MRGDFLQQPWGMGAEGCPEEGVTFNQPGQEIPAESRGNKTLTSLSSGEEVAKNPTEARGSHVHTDQLLGRSAGSRGGDRPEKTERFSGATGRPGENRCRITHCTRGGGRA